MEEAEVEEDRGDAKRATRVHPHVDVSQKGGALLKLQSGHLGVVGGFGVKTGYS